jgi:hypothetical protein
LISSTEKKDVWSFSRLTTFYNCPYCYYKTYTEGDRGESNIFAEYGLIVHDIIKKWVLNELAVWELVNEFKNQFLNMQYSFPPNQYCDLQSKYFEDGINYFKTFDEFKGYKFLFAEEECNFKIGNYEFTGFPDMVCEDNLGRLVIFDHKSSKPFDKYNLKEKIKQLYFYSIPVKEKIGRYPDLLIFNHFRNKVYDIHEFHEIDLRKTKIWALDTIKLIEEEKEFKPNTSNTFYCQQLCNHRNNCNFKEAING